MTKASFKTRLVDVNARDFEETFGGAAKIYLKIIGDIAETLTKETYTFEESGVFEQKACDLATGRSYAGRVYWTEILYRAHMGAVASIFRTTRWIDVAVRERSAGSVYGWASACRNLMESAGDIGVSLGSAPATLAQLKYKIKSEISTRASGPLYTSQDLEDSLIHFTHARKVGKSEQVPASHSALQTFKYIDYLSQMNIPQVSEFYGELCEIVHPAAPSVAVTFSGDGLTWKVNPEGERIFLNELVTRSQATLSDIIMASYNVPLLLLRTLQAFGIFARLPSLKKYQFGDIKEWQKVEALLKS